MVAKVIIYFWCRVDGRKLHHVDSPRLPQQLCFVVPNASSRWASSARRPSAASRHRVEQHSLDVERLAVRDVPVLAVTPDVVNALDVDDLS